MDQPRSLALPRIALRNGRFSGNGFRRTESYPDFGPFQFDTRITQVLHTTSACCPWLTAIAEFPDNLVMNMPLEQSEARRRGLAFG